MTAYKIIPAGPGYWITHVATNGLRKRVEKFDTEDAAIVRLRSLQKLAEVIERRHLGMGVKLHR